MSLLTEDQMLIQSMIREFAESEIRPFAAEIDKSSRFPVETVKKMADLGLLGMTIPAAFGGSAGDTVSYAIAVEEISRVCASHGAIFTAHISLAMGAILRYGTKAQKEKYLFDLAAGSKLGAFCLTDSAGSAGLG